MASPIGIVTYVYNANYGSSLQQYALQKTLRRFGLDVETIRYNPALERQLGSASFNSALRSSRGGDLARRVLRKGRRCFSRLGSGFFNRFVDNGKKKRRFSEFTNRFLTVSDEFKSLEELRARADSYGAVIAGSDQIWNPRGLPSESFYRYYLLDFVPSGKKLAYAPSLGVSKLEERLDPIYERYLRDFSWISTREIEGARELQRVLNRPVDVVLDPGALLNAEQWRTVVDSARTFSFEDKPYILCYSLRNKSQTLPKARQAQKFLNCPILFFCESEYERMRMKATSRSVIPIFDAGPCEFLRLISRSSCVVTDSFHASLFSILFHKPIFCAMRDSFDPYRSMNSRVTTLFSTLELESRLYSSAEEQTIGERDLEIDFDRVDKILAQKRDFSLGKLRDALASVGVPTASSD